MPADGTARAVYGRGVTVDGVQSRQLDTWLDEVERWNRRVDLTTVPRDQAHARHVDDAVHLLRMAPPPPAAAVVDVGSGAGSPGIPLAVLRPDLRVTLLDSDRRRCGFLLHVCGLLGLDGVEVLAARAEDAGRDPRRRESWDVAVSRATAPAPVLCELALPLLRVGGMLVAIVSGAESAARACAPAAGACGGDVPRALDARLLVVDKVAPTPDLYPRRAGTPARRPLG